MKAARAILLALLLGWVFPGLAALANVACRAGGRVVDQTGTLSGAMAASLNQTLRNFEARKGSQIAVLIVPTTDGEAIEQFALPGRGNLEDRPQEIDDGALLSHRQNAAIFASEVGYGLEGALTDVTSKAHYR